MVKMAQMADMKWFNMAINMVVIGGKIRKTVDQGIGKKRNGTKVMAKSKSILKLGQFSFLVGMLHVSVL